MATEVVSLAQNDSAAQIVVAEVGAEGVEERLFAYEVQGTLK